MMMITTTMQILNQPPSTELGYQPVPRERGKGKAERGKGKAGRGKGKAERGKGKGEKGKGKGKKKEKGKGKGEGESIAHCFIASHPGQKFSDSADSQSAVFHLSLSLCFRPSDRPTDRPTRSTDRPTDPTRLDRPTDQPLLLASWPKTYSIICVVTV